MRIFLVLPSLLSLLSQILNVAMAETVPKIELNDGKQLWGIGIAAHGFLNLPNEKEFIQRLKDAIDVGYRYFNCQPGTPGENYIADAIGAKIADGTVKREDLFISSEFWNTGYTREDVEKHCRISLKNLGLDYFDLYLLYWPMVFPNIESEEEEERLGIGYVDTWKGMEDILAKGLTKSIGVANFNHFQLDKLLKQAEIVPVINQIESHPYKLSKSLRDLCSKKNITIVSISSFGPFTAPNLPRKRPELTTLPEIKKMAENHGKTVEQILLRFQAQLGNSMLVMAPSTKEQFVEYLDIFKFELEDEEMRTLQGLDSENSS